MSSLPRHFIERAIALATDLVQDALGPAAEVHAIVPEFFRAKEPEGTVVGLRLHVSHPLHGTLERMLTVRWAALERLVEEGTRRRPEHDAIAAPLPAWRIFEEASCTSSVFPFDRRLPRAVEFLRARSVVRLLEASPEYDAAWRVRKRASRVHVLRYRPERRVVLRWDLAEKHDATGERRVRSVVVRAHAHALALPPDLLARVARAGLDAPRSLALPDRCLHVESFVAGRPLQFDGLPTAVTMRRLGVAIAQWHRDGDASGLPRSTPERLLRRARAAVENLAAVDHEHADRLRRSLASLGAELPTTSAEVALHGDLHPGQLVVEGPRLFLLDWDRAARGAAAEDLANLLVHLQTVARSVDCDATRALRQGYEEICSWPSIPELQWHLQAARLRLCDLGLRRPGLVASTWIEDVFAPALAAELRS